MNLMPRHALPGRPTSRRTYSEPTKSVVIARTHFLAIYHHGQPGQSRPLVMRGRNGSRVRRAAEIVLQHL